MDVGLFMGGMGSIPWNLRNVTLPSVWIATLLCPQRCRCNCRCTCRHRRRCGRHQRCGACGWRCGAGTEFSTTISWGETAWWLQQGHYGAQRRRHILINEDHTHMYAIYIIHVYNCVYLYIYTYIHRFHYSLEYIDIHSFFNEESSMHIHKIDFQGWW
jgi:hypothetical protein